MVPGDRASHSLSWGVPGTVGLHAPAAKREALMVCKLQATTNALSKEQEQVARTVRTTWTASRLGG